MRKLTTREVVLIVAVVGIGILGLVYGRGGTLGAGGGSKTELDKIDFGEAPEVQLARLAQGAVDFDPQARNLFSYYTPPPPKPKPRPKPPTRTVTPPVRNTQVATNRPPVPTPPKPEPRPPKPTFRYIGLIGPKDNKIAVLEQGDQVLLAGVGEVIDEQYKVEEFLYKALVIGYTAERWAGKTTELTMTK